MRRRRYTIALDEAERTELGRRARSHGVSVAEFIRTALCRRPGKAKSRDADAWWDALSSSRRDQVHRWLTAGHAPEGPIPGQLLIGSEPTTPMESR